MPVIPRKRQDYFFSFSVQKRYEKKFRFDSVLVIRCAIKDTGNGNKYHLTVGVWGRLGLLLVPIAIFMNQNENDTADYNVEDQDFSDLVENLPTLSCLYDAPFSYIDITFPDANLQAGGLNTWMYPWGGYSEHSDVDDWIKANYLTYKIDFSHPRFSSNTEILDWTSYKSTKAFLKTAPYYDRAELPFTEANGLPPVTWDTVKANVKHINRQYIYEMTNLGIPGIDNPVEEEIIDPEDMYGFKNVPGFKAVQFNNNFLNIPINTDVDFHLTTRMYYWDGKTMEQFVVLRVRYDLIPNINVWQLMNSYGLSHSYALPMFLVLFPLHHHTQYKRFDEVDQNRELEVFSWLSSSETKRYIQATVNSDPAVYLYNKFERNLGMREYMWDFIHGKSYSLYQNESGGLANQGSNVFNPVIDYVPIPPQNNDPGYSPPNNDIVQLPSSSQNNGSVSVSPSQYDPNGWLDPFMWVQGLWRISRYGK